MKNMIDINWKSRTVMGGLVLMATAITLFFLPDLMPGMDLEPSYLFIGGYAMVYGKS